MNSFAEKEAKCQLSFNKLGPCYHLWTKEDFEIIFRNEEEFRFGMGIVAIAAKLFPDVKVITFELMSNHLHILAAGVIARIISVRITGDSQSARLFFLIRFYKNIDTVLRVIYLSELLTLRS